jgi:hypothetical protein
MPEADAVEEDGHDASAQQPIPNGMADHGVGDHHGGDGEQNGIAEQNGISHEGDSAAEKQPVTFLDHEVGLQGSRRHRSGKDLNAVADATSTSSAGIYRISWPVRTQLVKELCC